MITSYDLSSFIHKYWFRFRTTFIIISPERRNIARREAEGQAFVQSRFVYFLENQSSFLCPSSSCNRCIVFLWRLPFQEICAVEENIKPILIKNKEKFHTILIWNTLCSLLSSCTANFFQVLNASIKHLTLETTLNCLYCIAWVIMRIQWYTGENWSNHKF